VIGGSTPAALAGDWVVSMLDQNAFVRASSRFADAAETVTLDWLRELVGLPTGWGGALTASATFANLTSLALATHWWAERHGVDVSSAGLAGLPRMPVLSGGYVHPSARKALQMLGHGKDTADSIATDAHKWLNVPYESGFALVREPDRLGPAFGMPGAAYLPGPDDPRGGYGLLGPESSRRARALPIWATLAAYGCTGYRELVERHRDLAAPLAATVDAAPDLERLAEVPLNVVCFRYRPTGLAEPEFDDVNRRLGEALLDDGRVFAGHHRLRWSGGAAPGDQQLAHHRGRSRPVRRGRPRVGRTRRPRRVTLKLSAYHTDKTEGTFGRVAAHSEPRPAVVVD